MNCDGLNDTLLQPLPRRCCDVIRLIVELRVIDGIFAFSAAEMVASRSFFRYKVVLFLMKIHVSKGALRPKQKITKTLLQN